MVDPFQSINFPMPDGEKPVPSKVRVQMLPLAAVQAIVQSRVPNIVVLAGVLAPFQVLGTFGVIVIVDGLVPSVVRFSVTAR